eukprot:gene16846-18545_t
MRANVLTVAFISIASALLQVAFSLTCLPCKETQCKEVQSLRCQGGLARDPCGCCFICAKLEGERCGGPWNIAGVCDKGLVCDSGAKKRFPRCTVKSRSESRRRFFDTSYGHRGKNQDVHDDENEINILENNIKG